MRTPLLAIAACLMLCGVAQARGQQVRHVPTEYATIQEAVDESSDGDEIVVAPGTYTGSSPYEVVNMDGKAVTLRSSNGPEVTIIDGEYARRGIYSNSNGTVIQGFTITNGFASSNGGGGIICQGNAVTITDCVITGNSTPNSGGGIYCFDSAVTTINDCTLSDNDAYSGGGIASDKNSSPLIMNTLFCNNDPEHIDGNWEDEGGNEFYDECPLTCLPTLDLVDPPIDTVEGGIELAVEGTTAIIYERDGDYDTGFFGKKLRFFHNSGGEWLEDEDASILVPSYDGGAIWYPRQYLALSGNTVVATSCVDGCYPTNDALVIIERNGQTWGVSQVLPDPTTENTLFGRSVDIDGDVIVAGASYSGGSEQEGVYVYRRHAGYWYLETHLALPEYGNIGGSVSVEGDTIIAGGGHDPKVVFNYDNSTFTWNEVQQITDAPGSGLDIHGDRAIIGTHIYTREEGTWTFEQELDVPEINASYGHASLGDNIVAFSCTEGGGSSTLIYEFDGQQWTLQVKLTCQLDTPPGWLGPTRVSVSERQAFAGLKPNGAVYGGSFLFNKILVYTSPDANADQADCNNNGICDSIDIANLADFDCDGNGVPDECDIDEGLQMDLDGNGIPDACEADCDLDGWPDAYELNEGLELDCNGNGIPDVCDVADMHSPDENGDGIPDECDPDYVINVAADGSAFFTEIQPALELALPGAMISVSPGTYLGPLHLPAHPVQLISTSGAEETILLGAERARVLHVPTGHDNDTRIQGFTLKGASNIEEGGGLLIIESAPTIQDCVFTENEAVRGGGVMITGSQESGHACQFVNCTWHNNMSTGGTVDTGGGGGLFVSESLVTLQFCTFDLNSSSFSGGGTWVENAGSVEAFDCTWSSNISPLQGGAICNWASTGNFELTDSLFCNNDPTDILGGWTDNGGNEFLDECPLDCDGDINGDGTVNIDDLLTVIAGWGDPYNVDDLLLVIGAWGPCP